MKLNSVQINANSQVNFGKKQKYYGGYQRTKKRSPFNQAKRTQISESKLENAGMILSNAKDKTKNALQQKINFLPGKPTVGEATAITALLAACVITIATKFAPVRQEYYPVNASIVKRPDPTEEVQEEVQNEEDSIQVELAQETETIPQEITAIGGSDVKLLDKSSLPYSINVADVVPSYLKNAGIYKDTIARAQTNMADVYVTKDGKTLIIQMKEDAKISDFKKVFGLANGAIKKNNPTLTNDNIVLKEGKVIVLDYYYNGSPSINNYDIHHSSENRKLYIDAINDWAYRVSK